MKSYFHQQQIIQHNTKYCHFPEAEIAISIYQCLKTAHCLNTVDQLRNGPMADLSTIVYMLPFLYWPIVAIRVIVLKSQKHWKVCDFYLKHPVAQWLKKQLTRLLYYWYYGRSYSVFHFRFSLTTQKQYTKELCKTY